MMKDVINHFQSGNTSTRAINFFMLFVIVFLAIVGVGAVLLIGYEVFNQQMLNPLVSSIMLAMIVSATTIINVTHNSHTINGTAAAAAAQTAENLQPAIEQANRTNATNAETIQQMLRAMMEQQKTLQKANIEQSVAAPIAAVIAEKTATQAVLAAGLAGMSAAKELPVVTLAPDIAALATNEGAIAHTMKEVQPAMIEEHKEEKSAKKRRE